MRAKETKPTYPTITNTPPTNQPTNPPVGPSAWRDSLAPACGRGTRQTGRLVGNAIRPPPPPPDDHYLARAHYGQTQEANDNRTGDGLGGLISAAAAAAVRRKLWTKGPCVRGTPCTITTTTTRPSDDHHDRWAHTGARANNEPKSARARTGPNWHASLFHDQDHDHHGYYYYCCYSSSTIWDEQRTAAAAAVVTAAVVAAAAAANRSNGGEGR